MNHRPLDTQNLSVVPVAVVAFVAGTVISIVRRSNGDNE